MIPMILLSNLSSSTSVSVIGHQFLISRTKKKGEILRTCSCMKHHIFGLYPKHLEYKVRVSKGVGMLTILGYKMHHAC